MNGYGSRGGNVDSVIEFDTLESQASTSGSFENGCGNVSGVVADDRLLIMGQKTGRNFGDK